MLKDVRSRVDGKIQELGGTLLDSGEPARPAVALTARQFKKQVVDLFDRMADLPLDDMMTVLNVAKIRLQKLQAIEPRNRPVVGLRNFYGEITQKVPPLISYTGSKTCQSHYLMGVIGHVCGDLMHGDYVFREPFAGSAVMSVNMLASGRANRVWLNDKDPAVAALLTTVIRDPDALKKRVRAQEKLTRRFFFECRAILGAGLAAPLDLVPSP